MLHYLIIGTLLGLSAGFAPGPLLTLVISETLKHDIRAGLKVAFAPLISDLPIVLLTVLVLAKLSQFNIILAIISFVGAVFIFFMGVDSMRTKGQHVVVDSGKPKSLMKGVLVNVLSPHPYLFWFSVGAPILVKASAISTGASALFIISFYCCLIGAKVVLAMLVDKSRRFLQGSFYIYTMKLLGLLLCLLALFLVYDGVKLLSA